MRIALSVVESRTNCSSFRISGVNFIGLRSVHWGPDAPVSITYVILVIGKRAYIRNGFDGAGINFVPMTKGALSGLRVLIVEDEYFLADDLKQTLAGYGADVAGPVPTPAAGLQALELFDRIDFAVLDVHLRGHDVFPVSAALQERGIPFLFATGFDNAQIPAEYRDVPRLEKPFDPVALVAAIGAALGVAEPGKRGAG